MSKPVALITGASSGIGEALARMFARNGHDLVITARRESRLDEIAEDLGVEVGVTVIPADLSASRGAHRLARDVAEAGIEVDVLVNNAGIGGQGQFHNMANSKVAEMINVNVRALTEITLALVPPMVARGNGRILNVASVVAFRAFPGMTVYSASKAFVLSFSESLTEELRGTGVTVTALCPGLTKTEMVDDVAGANVPDFLIASAEDVAREGFDACMRGEVIRVPGQMNQAMVAWLELQPRWLTRMLSGFAARATLPNQR